MQRPTQLNSAVAISIEGLGTGTVGAYGSSTAVTPAIDSLAAQGVLLDQCFVDSLDPLEQLTSLWTAEHSLQLGAREWKLWYTAQACSGESWQARLLTDCPRAAQLAAQLGCERITLIDPPTPTAPCEETAQSALMMLFAAAAEELASGPAGLIWIHSRGLRLPWDAPLALRNQFVDPEDPPPPAEILPPSLETNADTDPDWLVGWGQVAAAQTAVLDEAVGGLLHTVAARADQANWAWLLTSLGGIPLGEHGRCGAGVRQLYTEEIHSATMLVPTPALPVGYRRPELFQLPDVGASLASQLGLNVPPACWGMNILQCGAAEPPQRWPRELALAMISNERQVWVRTPAWSALWDTPADAAAETAMERLFVKPEDRWEVSEIASRRRDIMERHHQLAVQFRTAVQQRARAQLPVLEDELLNLLR